MEKPTLKCQFCPRTFPHYQTRARHYERDHSEELRQRKRLKKEAGWPCEVGCERTFASYASLKNHRSKFHPKNT